MSFYDAIRVGASGAAGAFEVERSLRFNDNDTAYLSRNFGTGGNRKKWTFSVWIKRANLGSSAGEMRIFGGSTNASHIFFASNDELTWDVAAPGSSASANLNTTQVFRDTSAWFHLVCAFDTDNSTADNRMRMYINGSEITSFGTRTNPSSGYAANAINADAFADGDRSLHTIGYRTSVQGSAGMEFDGYMAEINFIDGQQYDPSYFGETNPITGQWNPKKYVGGYGTTGFYLPLSDNSGTTATTLGKDSSGNGNNFTPNNFGGTAIDQLKDTPTNNFCTLNPLNATNDVDLREGNLEFFQSSNDESATATFGITSGKWYWEVYKNSSENPELGIETNERVLSNKTDDVSPTKVCFRTNGGDQQVGTGTPTSITGSSGGQTGAGVIAIAVDFDNKKIWYSDLSGNFFNSGNPATGSNAAFDFSSVAVANGCVPYFFCGTGGNNSFNINFGQDGTFAGHTTAGGYADGNGHGNFKYSVPSGYLALCSANLPDPTILLPNKHFNTLLYTGNDSSDRDITGVGFQPDWLWIKNRQQADWHQLCDAVRGANKVLFSNTTDGESTDNSNGHVNSFLADGFNVDAGAGGNVNENNENYVAWNWNAGDTDGATYTVKVVSDSGNKYRFNNFGTSAVTLDLAEGGTYTFDGSDSSMSGHPFVIGTAANGSEYSTGVTYQLDGASVTYSQYTSGYSSATTRKLIITVPASAPQLYYWCSIHSGMGGAINTNSTLGSSNFDGSIQTTVKVNASAGFSITTYTGDNASGNSTLGHGLGVAPEVVFIKRRNSSSPWIIGHDGITANAFANSKYLYLNTAEAVRTTSIVWGAQPTSTVVQVTTGSGATNLNASGGTYVMYNFSSVAGYSKFGSYIGNGSSDGPFVFTGFRPAFVITKLSDGTGTWRIFDKKRAGFNVRNYELEANSSATEDTGTYLDLLSNGFKIRNNGGYQNENNGVFIYLAFAESPFKNARAR